MTSRHHNRRITENVQSAARDVLRTTDLDERLLILKQGRITINLDRLARELRIPDSAGTAEAVEIDTFAGPGTTGLVPDPLSSSGRFLDDAGDWTAIPGGGDMLKATYDADLDGISDAAEQLEGPTAGLNISTAASVAAHLATAHVPTTRLISTTLPIAGGGDLSADRTISFSNFSAVSRLFGAGSGGASPAEITLGTNLAMAGTVLNASGGGSPTNAQYVTLALDATLTDERTLAVGAALSLVDGGAGAAVTLDRAALTGDVTASAGANATTIANDAVTNAKLANMVAHTVKVRAAGTTGDPSDLAIAGNSTMLRVGTAALSSEAFGANDWLGRGISGSLGAQNTTTLLVSLLTAMVGAAFPGSPVDGQPFYHTGVATLFVYDDGAGAWLSVAVYEIAFGDTASVASGNYFRQYPISSATRYSATVGERFGFDVIVVGITVDVQASSTCTITVQDDGSDVSGGAISLAAEVFKRDETLLSSAIAADSVIAVECTSGTATTGASGRVRFRRRQT